MANVILTPDIIAKEALMVLRNNAVMANLVHRNYSSDFNGAVGDTITIRKPATFVANEFTSSIVIQEAKEGSVAVTLDKFLDVSFNVTAKEMTLDIADFSTQFLVPAMQAFADKIDGYLLAVSSTIDDDYKVAGTGDIRKDMINARKSLTANAVPLTERAFVFGSDIEADLLNTDLFISAEQVGDQGTALREASLGRKFGLDCYVDQNVDDMAAPLSIAFHKNSMALVTRQVAPPLGSEKVAIVNYDGFALRVVYGYDQTTKKDTISIDMLCGVKLLDEKMISTISAYTPS